MRNTPETRASLLIRLHNPQDERAWQDFLEIYQPAILEMARAKGLQASDAQDVLQDVLSSVVKKVETWDHDESKGSFRGWLATITRNLVIDYFRQRNRRPASLDPQDSAIDSAHRAPEETQFDLQQRRQLFRWAAQRCRGSFTESTWLAFWRTAVEHQAVADVASELKLTSGAVYIARSRVMAKLRECLAEASFETLDRVLLEESQP